MLWTVVVATLLVLCALGLVASATIGGLRWPLVTMKGQ
jgi:hypothetical protein